MYNESDNLAVGYALGRDSNDNNGWGNGAEWIWIIVLFALFGWGGNGFGGFGGNGGGFANGYDLGKLATTTDVASGFNNSAVLSSLNDLKLGQAGVQQTLCQGFNGVNTSILTSANQTQNGIANLGYQLQQCCCDMKSIALENRYLNERQTCDLITNQNANTQRIVDLFTSDKIASLQAENSALTAQLSQNAQTRTLIDSLRPCPIPAYITCSPFESVYGYGYGRNNGCGCNSCGM